MIFKPLFISNLHTLCRSFIDTFVANTRASADLIIIIQPEACILPFLRLDLLKDIFNYDIPGADSVIAMADALSSNNMQLIKFETNKYRTAKE